MPANLPASITVDLSGMTANANLHLESIKLPRGVTYAGNDTNPLLAAALPVGGGAASEETEERAE